MPKTLLLADDSITIQKVVKLIFGSEELSEYSVITVDNGEDALSKVRELRPDLLLADVVMPRKNGYELCEAVKNDADLRSTPVLLLSGTFEAFDEARARAVGADGWISKPFESAALVGKVREIVEGIAPPAVSAQPWATASTTPAPAIAPPSPGAPLPAGARPLPGAAPGPFAQPFAPPRPPSPPFAARSPAFPPPPPPPPFGARPPQPPAPPPPPSFRDAPPAFTAPRPQQPFATPTAPSFSAPAAPVIVPFPPPPPPPPSVDLAPPAMDFAPSRVEPEVDLLAPPVELAPPPASPPPAPAIPTQKVLPPVEPEADLDFDIDEAAAPIDLTDLAAEEITEEEAFVGQETGADGAPPPEMDLFDEARTPPALDLERTDVVLGQPFQLSSDGDAVESLELPAPEAFSQPASPDEPLELQPEPELADAAFLGSPEPEPELEPAAEPRPFQTTDPFRPGPFDQLEPFAGEPMPFQVEPEQQAEPAAELLAAAAQAPAEHLEPAPEIAASADEAVLRDVLSRASRDTIERVVWEVVPQLAETIIREHLERLMQDRKNS